MKNEVGIIILIPIDNTYNGINSNRTKAVTTKEAESIIQNRKISFIHIYQRKYTEGSRRKVVKSKKQLKGGQQSMKQVGNFVGQI